MMSFSVFLRGGDLLAPFSSFSLPLFAARDLRRLLPQQIRSQYYAEPAAAPRRRPHIRTPQSAHSQVCVNSVNGTGMRFANQAGI